MKRITSVTDALSATASLGYNSLDAVTSASDFKGVATSYTRDALGNAIQEAGNDAGTHTAQYDALGLPSQLTDALGQTTAITRDAMGRPTLLAYTGGRTTTLSYDLTGSTYNAPGAPNASKGYLSKIEDSSGITTYQRDALGRITVKTQTLTQTAPNNTTQQVGYSYNSQGLVDTITYPSGNALVHSYSAAGQLTGLSWNSTPLISSLTWTAAGQPASWTWPFATSGISGGTNINATRTYDTAGRVTATELSGYGYDAAGRLTTLSQSLYAPSDSNPANSGITLGTTNWSVGYDAVSRITSFNDAATSSTSGFTYDANGNRLTSSQSPGPAAGITSRSRTYSITTNTNRLASYSQTDVVSGSPVNTTTTFSINANGDTTGDGTRTYGFDVESRLASTSTGSSPTISTSRYSHNALGQRTFKTLPVIGTPTTADPGYAFAYDEDGTLMGEYGAGGTPSAGSTEYIWLPSPNGPVPVAAVINGSIFAIQADHLNTPRRLSNTSAQAVWQWKYSAFGDEQPTLAANRFADLAMNPTPGTTTIPPVTFNLRYPGQYADVESGLYYNYFRSYNPDTGGYPQADPIGLDGGWNKFGYVGGNPLDAVDPLGLDSVFEREEKRSYRTGRATCGPAYQPGDDGNAPLESICPECTLIGLSFSALKGIVSPWRSGAKDTSAFFRGAKPGQSPSFSPRPSEFKIDPQTGTVAPTHGVSVFNNELSVTSKSFNAYQVNPNSVPSSLQIIQRGRDLSHFEITPAPGANLTVEQFTKALGCITCK